MGNQVASLRRSPCAGSCVMCYGRVHAADPQYSYARSKHAPHVSTIGMCATHGGAHAGAFRLVLGVKCQGGNAGRDVDAFFGLKRDRLQGDGAMQAATENLGADTDAERRISGDAGIGAG